MRCALSGKSGSAKSERISRQNPRQTNGSSVVRKKRTRLPLSEGRPEAGRPSPTVGHLNSAAPEREPNFLPEMYRWYKITMPICTGVPGFFVRAVSNDTFSDYLPQFPQNSAARFLPQTSGSAFTMSARQPLRCVPPPRPSFSRCTICTCAPSVLPMRVGVGVHPARETRGCKRRRIGRTGCCRRCAVAWKIMVLEWVRIVPTMRVAILITRSTAALQLMLRGGAKVKKQCVGSLRKFACLRAVP